MLSQFFEERYEENYLIARSINKFRECVSDITNGEKLKLTKFVELIIFVFKFLRNIDLEFLTIVS